MTPVTNINNHEDALKLRDELAALGLTVHLEEVANTANPTTPHYRVFTDPVRIDAAKALRLLALQYEHYAYCHFEADGRVVFSGAGTDA
jgi:hypothetical protein